MTARYAARMELSTSHEVHVPVQVPNLSILDALHPNAAGHHFYIDRGEGRWLDRSRETVSFPENEGWQYKVWGSDTTHKQRDAARMTPQTRFDTTLARIPSRYIRAATKIGAHRARGQRRGKRHRTTKDREGLRAVQPPLHPSLQRSSPLSFLTSARLDPVPWCSLDPFPAPIPSLSRRAMGIMWEIDAPSGTGIAADLLETGLRGVQLGHETAGEPGRGRINASSRTRRYAVLLCADDSDHVRRRYGGYLGVFRRLLAEEGERWDAYRVSRGQFPPGWGEEDGDVEGREALQAASLDRYDGFVVSGSSSDAHADEPWILSLVALLRAACDRGKRVLGICFGHQVLCRALGGKTGRNASGWDIGVTSVNFNLFPPASKQHHPEPEETDVVTTRPLLRILPSSLAVIMCHQDEVLELPPGAEALAWSEKTGVEAFRYGDVAMGIQGHPEYTQDILLDLIDRLLQRNLIQVSHANAARDSLGAIEVHRESWRRLCNSFLKGRTKDAVTTATIL